MEMLDFLRQFVLLGGDPGGWWHRDANIGIRRRPRIYVGIGTPAGRLGGCFFQELVSGCLSGCTENIKARPRIGILIEM